MRLLTVCVASLVGFGSMDVDTGTDTYPRRTGIDVENYRFELTLADSTDALEGRATVRVRFTKPGVSELPLDLVSLNETGFGMTVSSVTSTKGPLQYTHADDLLNIRVPEAKAEGSYWDVVIEYRGIAAGGLRIGPNKFGERTFFSDNWPNRAHDWLPTIDHISEKATSEFVVTAPAHYQVVSNGLLVEETDRPDGRRLTHWRQSVPISPWLYVLGVARFAVQHLGDLDGKPIQTWVYAQDRDAGFHDFAVPTRQAMEFYEAYVGPFAYEKLANITSPATGGGMEAATAIMYGENSVTGQRSTRWRNVIIHEVAHQWFGNAVTESDWDDVWLSEGFATYFTLLFIEHAYGRDEMVEGLKSAAERVWSWYDENPGYRIVHDNLDDMSRVTSVATYQKGAWVLHMLRRRMGDEAFWSGIQAYYARYMNGSTTTSEFRVVMEEASGQDLELFFEQWLYSGGNPRLEGWWEYDADSGTVTIEIRQTQDVGPLFHLALDVGVYEAGFLLPATVETVQISGERHLFEVAVEGEPSEVRLDPGTWALFTADFGPRGSR